MIYKMPFLGKQTSKMRSVGKTASGKLRGYSFGIHFKAENVGEVINSMLAKYPDCKSAMRQALVQSAEAIATRSNQLCPKDTGYLRSSQFLVRGFENGSVRIKQQTLVDNAKTQKRGYKQLQSQIDESANFVGAEERAGRPAVAVGYSASHFLPVHEINNRHKGLQQWKFLETAYKELMPNTLRRLEKATRSAWTARAKRTGRGRRYLGKGIQPMASETFTSGEKLGF